MLGVLTGFAIVLTLIGVGYLLAVAGVLGATGEQVLSRFAYNAALPALLFTLVAPAHISEVFSGQFVALTVAALTAIGGYLAIGAWRRWGLLPTAIGGLASGYVNAGNLGIPVAVYVLGSPAPVVSVMLLQLLFLAPVSLSILDIATGVGGTVSQRIVKPFRNPVVIAALAALICSTLQIPIPDVVMQPLDLLGQATVPVMLTAFGISLRTQARPLSVGPKSPTLLAVGLKLLLGPAVAWLVGAVVLRLPADALLQAVICAALPTAQNVYLYSRRYPDESAQRIGRDTVLITTIASLPVIIIWVLLLG